MTLLAQIVPELESKVTDVFNIEPNEIVKLIESFKGVRLKKFSNKTGFLVYHPETDQFVLVIYNNDNYKVVNVLSLKTAKESSWSEQIIPRYMVNAIERWDDLCFNDDIKLKILHRHAPFHNQDVINIEFILRLTDYYETEKVSMAGTIIKKLTTPTSVFKFIGTEVVDVAWMHQSIVDNFMHLKTFYDIKFPDTLTKAKYFWVRHKYYNIGLMAPIEYF